MDTLIKLPEKLPEPINQFLKDLLGPSFEELGLFFGDQIRLLRFNRCINILQKAQDKIQKSHINPQSINLKFLVPFLEKSTLEEDALIIDKWAGLLANAATTHTLSYNYITLLDGLNPIEVQLLDQMYNFNLQNNSTYEDWKTQGFERDDLCDALKISKEQYELMANNLFRLNLCQPIGTKGVMFGDQPVAVKTSKIINLTLLGFDFTKACKGPIENKGKQTPPATQTKNI